MCVCVCVCVCVCMCVFVFQMKKECFCVRKREGERERDMKGGRMSCDFVCCSVHFRFEFEMLSLSPLSPPLPLSFPSVSLPLPGKCMAACGWRGRLPSLI